VEKDDDVAAPMKSDGSSTASHSVEGNAPNKGNHSQSRDRDNDERDEE
jgi:hypothetical protein